MIEITGFNLKLYVASLNNCDLASKGYVLKSNGRLVLDLRSIKFDKVVLLCKRLRGSDGLIEINGKLITLPPSQMEEIEISGNEISISKPRSVGDILVYGVRINELKQEPVVNMTGEWFDLLNRLKRVKGIRRTDLGLLATEGAEIMGANIIRRLESDPPDVFIKCDDIIKFVYPCRIINIELFDDQIPFVPVKSFVEELLIKNNTEKRDNMDLIYEICPKTNDTDGLVIVRGGKFEIEAPNLNSYSDFLVLITCKRVGGGNGKFNVSIETKSGVRDMKMAMTGTSEVEIGPMLNSGCEPDIGDDYIIKITRPELMSVGDIFVSKIRVLGKAKNISTLLVTPLIDTIPNETNNYIRKGEIVETVETVKTTSQNHSVLTLEKFNGVKSDISGVIEISTYSSKRWFAKIANITNIYPKYHGYYFYDSKSSTNDSNILMCSIYNLNKSNKRMFVEEFDFMKMGDYNLSLLNNCEQIYTPSFINKYHLESKIRKEINICGRYWPLINIGEKKKEHYVYFEKNIEYTKILLSTWESNYEDLYVIGSSETIPKDKKNIKYVNAYDSYEDAYRLLSSAKGLIDFSKNTHYISSIVELGLCFGLKVITNNHNYLGKVNLVRNDQESKSSIEVCDLKKAYGDVGVGYVLGEKEYNDNYINSLKTMVGV